MTTARNKQKKARAPGVMPDDYPFWDENGEPVLTESIAAYAKRIGKNKETTRWHCDKANIPTTQPGPRKKREVNLYAVYLKIKRNAEKYVDMTE
ncbi:DNA-binding protein [Salmonella enterica subsp. enterica serovar Muenchen]|nr:DNA-binding protein [Salmonella enterica subsp. enterica serovar Muenchen]ECR4176470.1 DNA-binding protein [Salmonella enterica]EFU9020146.1 DNA-binding protein [Salmonella enterica]